MIRNYLKSNIELIKKTQPKLGQKLKEIKTEKRPFIQYGLTQTDALEKKPDDPVDALILLGPILETHPHEILEKTCENALIIVVEHDPMYFKDLLRRRDLSLVLSKRKVHFAILEHPVSAIRLTLDQHFDTSLSLAKIKILEINSYTRLRPAYYAEIKQQIQNALDMARQNIATLARFAPLWRRNIFENLPYIISSHGVNKLYDVFKGHPAIVVAAGPSLDKNVSCLKRALNHAVIICVDTALKTLLGHGIPPDLVVSTDGGEENLGDFKGVDTSCITLVAASVVNPKIIKDFKGNILFCDYGHPIFRWLEGFVGKKGEISIGESVSTAAFDLARRLGCDPIVLTGLDLAYTDKLPYSIGCPIYEEWISEINKFQTLEMKIRDEMKMGSQITMKNKGEGEVITTQKMLNVKKWFEAEIVFTESRVYNATEGGIQIKGATPVKLSEAISALCKVTFDPKGEIKSHMASDKGHPPASALEEALKGLLLECTEISQITDEGLRLIKSQDPPIPELHSFIRDINKKRQFRTIFRWSIEPLLFKINRLGREGTGILKQFKETFEGLGKIASETASSIKGFMQTIKSEQ